MSWERTDGSEHMLRRSRRVDVVKHLVAVRLVFSLTSLGLMVIGLLAYTPGFDVTPPGLLIYLALLGVPVFFYVAATRTTGGSYVTGVALLILVAWVQGYMSTHSFSSTAPVGYVWLFLGGSIIVLLALRVERLAISAGSENGHDPPA
jgi:hypothetical protein